MPDVFLFLKASFASVSASAVTVLALTFWVGRRPHTLEDGTRGARILLLGFLIGTLTGYGILDFHWTWPPGNALNRFLELILPSVLFTELLACSRWLTASRLWILRGIMAAGAGRILLHGSVYLPADSWAAMPAPLFLALLLGTLSLLMVWRLLTQLAETDAGAVVALALALSLQAGGAAIMLAGYIKGGVAAIPLASALASTALTALLLRNRFRSQAVCSIALMSLYCLILIGCYFGALSPTHGILIFFAPCLCLVSRWPPIRSLKNRTRIILCLAVVSLPLLVVMIQSTIAFRQRMAPLLSQHPAAFVFIQKKDA